MHRILLALLVMFVMAACGDSPKGMHNKQNAVQAPTLPAKPIVPATSTVGTLPHSSGASAAGEYQIEVPLDVPAGRAGMAPMLSLAYSSGAGRDSGGVGWSLRGAGSFIRYCAPTLATHGYAYVPNQFCLDQQMLVSIGENEWRTENESFSKIIVTSRDAQGTPGQWEVWGKDGRIRTYEAVKYDGEQIRFWALASERDRIGNRIDYKYRHIEEAPYQRFVFDIERIEYTASESRKARRSIQFHYEPIGAPAHVRIWDAFAQTHHQRDISAVLVTVDMYGPNEKDAIGLAWSYSLGYERSVDTDRPLLTSIKRCGALGGCLQTRTFQYSQRPPGVKDTYSTIWEHVRNEPIPREQIRVVDANGDGRDDVHVALGLYNSTTFVSADPAEAIASTTIPGPDAVTVDINGDGKPELVGTRTLSEKPLKWEKWIYRTSNDGKYAPWKKLPNTDALWDGDPYVAGYNALYTEIFGVRFGDLDGDGLPDLCRERPAHTLEALDPSVTAIWRCAKNRGDGTFGAWDLGAHITHWGDGRVYLADLDGDGRAEFHHGDDTIADTDGDGLLDIVATSSPDGLTVGDFDGDGRDDVIEDAAFLADENTLLNVGLFRGDFDGNGRDDLLRVWVDSARRTHFKAVTMRGGDPDRLIEVADEGSEWRERITYTRTYGPDVDLKACDVPHPLACVRRGASVVARIESRTGTPRDLHYGYGQPIFDRLGRGFLGYTYVREWEPDRPRQTTTYFSPNWTERGPLGTPYIALYAFRPHLIVEVTPIVTHPLGGAVPALHGSVKVRVHARQIRSEVEWMHGGKTYFIHPADGRSCEWETTVDVDSTAWLPIQELPIEWDSPRRVDYNVKFDEMGNLQWMTRHTRGGTSEVVSFSYDIREKDWLVSLLERRTSTSMDASGATATRYEQFGHDANGLLETIEIERDEPDAYQRIHYVRNGDGLVVEEKTTITPNTSLCPTADGCPRTNYFEYDNEGVFITKTWNALNHTRWVVMHPSLGVPMAATDENGILSQWVHDDLARVVNVSRDGGAAVAMTYAPWFENGFIRGVESTSQASDNKQTLVHIDDQGRTIESRKQGFDGTWSQVTNSFDALGRVWRVNRPAEVGANLDTVASTTMQFDSLDRVVTTKMPNGLTVTSGHSMFFTTTTDSLGRERSEFRDKDGRVVQVLERVNTSPPGTPPDKITYDKLRTYYEYGPYDQLKKITDPNGNVTSIEYDVRGHRTSITDPDAGTHTSQYNGHGELMHETIGGDERAYTRDVLGRVETLQSVDGLTQWVYDTKALGKLSVATSAFGVQTEYDYDELARLRDTTWTVHGETFNVTTTYDALDRVDTLAFPDVAGLGRTTMQQRYNAFGYVERIDEVSPGQAGKTIWHVKERNREGELVKSISGDTLVTTNAYDELTGQLEGIRVQTPNGADVYHVGMLYDAAGRMEARTDYVENRQESFVNDDLSRLRQWKLQPPGNGVQTSVYSYDRLSSLVKVERNGAVEQHYAHGNEGRPRAIQHDYKPLGAYTYDDRGRVIQGGGRSMVYSDADLPTSVTTAFGTTLFEYDAANQRVVKTSPNEKTIYIGGLYERRESASGTVHVFHIEGIADIVYDANAVIPRQALYVHGDALGSTSLVTDGMGNERERLFYAPFGARVDIDGNPPTGPPSDIRNGFTGHRHDDELGLIDMRGRVFDTKTSRFPTPDPFIADPMFSPSLNRFAYVEQSPLNWVDSTGFNPETTRRAEWFASVNSPGINLAPPSSIGAGAIDGGLIRDVTAGIAGMQFPAGSDAVNTSGCPKGTGTAPRPCAAAAQAGCPSGNGITDSWGFRFAKGMLQEKVTDLAITSLRVPAAVFTLGGSEIALAGYGKAKAAHDGYRQDGVMGAGIALINTANPLYGLGTTGARLYHAIDGGNPEEIGAAAVPVVEAAVGVAAGKFAPNVRAAKFGAATSTNYRATFFAAYPELEGRVIVHHGVEQQVLTRFPGIVTEAEIHSLENLRGIPMQIHPAVHLSQIRKSWNQFYRSNARPTRQQLLEHATKIDDLYGHLFEPPVRP